MRTPHKHAELIKAWADGATSQYYCIHAEKWITTETPLWGENTKYRIKPEPKPDVVLNVVMEFSHSWKLPKILCSWNGENRPLGYSHHQPTIKFTFDGETGELKEAVKL